MAFGAELKTASELRAARPLWQYLPRDPCAPPDQARQPHDIRRDRITMCRSRGNPVIRSRWVTARVLGA